MSPIVPHLPSGARPAGQLAHPCGFQILPRAKQFARSLPNKKPPLNARVIKWWAVQTLPTSPSADATGSRARLAVLALLCKLAHPCGFQILPRAKQFARFLPQKKPRQERGLNGGQYRLCLQVPSLTLGARRPASRCSPCLPANSHIAAARLAYRQTRTSLRPSNPAARKAVCALSA